jgi:anti-anti-sigma factor
MLKPLSFILFNPGVTLMKISKATIIKPNGSLTAMNSQDFQMELTQSLKQPHTESLLLDMENIDFLDSAGLMSLVRVLQLAIGLGKNFSLCALSPSVRIIFEVTQLEKSFTIFQDIKSYQSSSTTALSLDEYLVA